MQWQSLINVWNLYSVTVCDECGMIWYPMITFNNALGKGVRKNNPLKVTHLNVFDHFRTLLKKWWGISGLCAKKWWWWYFSSCATWQLHPLTINKNSLTSFLMISTIDLVKKEEKLKCIFFFLRKTAVSLVFFFYSFLIGLLSFFGFRKIFQTMSQ